MSLVALICLVLVTTRVPAQQRDPLQAAWHAMGAGTVNTLHLAGFGATYSVRPAPAPREIGRRVPLTSYEADVDFSQGEMRVRLVGEAGAAQPQPVAGHSQQIWSTPQGFLKAARANQATTRVVPLGAEVSFTAGGRHYVGLINARNEVDRVQAWIGDPALGDLPVETLFRDYDKTPLGVPFPTHITQSLGSHPLLDVWLSAVALNRDVDSK
jgi:hypothetical protein